MSEKLYSGWIYYHANTHVVQIPSIETSDTIQHKCALTEILYMKLSTANETGEIVDKFP